MRCYLTKSSQINSCTSPLEKLRTFGKNMQKFMFFGISNRAEGEHEMT